MKTLGQFANPNLVVNEKGIWQPVLVLCKTHTQLMREKERWPMNNVFLMPENPEDAGIHREEFPGDQYNLTLGLLDPKDRHKNIFNINVETGFRLHTELVEVPDNEDNVLVLFAQVDKLNTNDGDQLEDDIRQNRGYLGTRCLVESTLAEDRSTVVNVLRRVVAVDFYIGQLGEGSREEGD